MIVFRELSWTDPRVREIVEEAAAIKARLPMAKWQNVILLSMAFLLLDFDKAEWDGILGAVKDQAGILDDMVTPVWDRLKHLFG